MNIAVSSQHNKIIFMLERIIEKKQFLFKQIYTKTNMFNCDICQKICKSKAGLVSHQRIHYNQEIIFNENEVVIQELIIQEDDIIELKQINSINEYITYESTQESEQFEAEQQCIVCFNQDCDEYIKCDKCIAIYCKLCYFKLMKLNCSHCRQQTVLFNQINELSYDQLLIVLKNMYITYLEFHKESPDFKSSKLYFKGYIYMFQIEKSRDIFINISRGLVERDIKDILIILKQCVNVFNQEWSQFLSQRAVKHQIKQNQIREQKRLLAIKKYTYTKQQLQQIRIAFKLLQEDAKLHHVNSNLKYVKKNKNHTSDASSYIQQLINKFWFHLKYNTLLGTYHLFMSRSIISEIITNKADIDKLRSILNYYFNTDCHYTYYESDAQQFNEHPNKLQ